MGHFWGVKVSNMGGERYNYVGEMCQNCVGEMCYVEDCGAARLSELCSRQFLQFHGRDLCARRVARKS